MIDVVAGVPLDPLFPSSTWTVLVGTPKNLLAVQPSLLPFEYIYEIIC